MEKSLVNIKRSKRAKRVALRLDPVERVINLVIPPNMSKKKAYAFAAQHQDWIETTLKSLAPPVHFTHGQHLPLFGDTISLDIVYDTSLKRTSIKQHDNVLSIKTYQDDPTNRIKAHLKKMAQQGLADIASDKAEDIGKVIKSVSVRDTKTRWGSCSSDKTISFSWRLIFAPYDAIDYVVAHEVAHLVHMDHSKDFWKLCRELSSNFVEGKYWMQNHGNDLMRYGMPIKPKA